MCQNIRYRTIKGERFHFRVFSEKTPEKEINVLDFHDLSRLFDAIGTINEVIGYEIVRLSQITDKGVTPVEEWRDL